MNRNQPRTAGAALLGGFGGLFCLPGLHFFSLFDRIGAWADIPGFFWGCFVLKNGFKFRGSYLCYAMTYFFFYFCMGVFLSVLSIYLTTIGKTTSEMTFIVSASSLFGIVMIPIVGFFNDRVQKPRVLAAALLAAVAVFGVLFAVSKSTWALYVLDGLIMGLVSSLSPVCERMAGSGCYRYGMVRCWGTIGYAVASQISAILLDITDPRLIFIVFAVSAAISAVGFLCADGISFDKGDAERTDKSGKKQFSFMRQPMFWLFVVIAMIFSGISNLNNTFSSILLKELGLSNSLVGTALSIGTLVELPIVLFSNKFMDRFSGKALSAASFVIMMIQFLIYSASTSVVPAFITLILLKAIGTTLFMMVILKVIKGIVQENAVSTAQGTVNSVNSLAAIFMQNLGGWIVEATSIRFLYIVLAVLAVIAFVLCMFLKVKNTKSVFS